MNTEIRNKVEKILKEHFASLDDQTPIYKQLSSIDLVSLIAYMETEFNVSIHAIEYDQSFFENEETITDFMEQKLQRGK